MSDRIILGIDPGSRNTGYGIISTKNSSEELIVHGVIKPLPNSSLPLRLNSIKKELDQIITTYNPQQIVVEDIFLGKNPKSAFVLGHVRGVCLQTGAQHNLEVYEYAPRKIKKVVTGNGAASKELVRQVVTQLLALSDFDQYDSTDALAVAITHSRTNHIANLTKRALEL